MSTKSNNDIANILLPIIQKITPTVIANDIVGVQPMTSTKQYELDVEEILNELQEVMYCVTVRFSIMSVMPLNLVSDKIHKWTIDTFKDRVIVSNTKYYFKYEKDRTLFLLKWSI